MLTFVARQGRMFIPVGTVSQSIMQVDKDEHGVVHKKHLFGVNYVPYVPRVSSSERDQANQARHRRSLTDPDLQYP